MFHINCLCLQNISAELFYKNCIYLPLSLSCVLCILPVIQNQTKNVSYELSLSTKSNKKKFPFLIHLAPTPFSTASESSAELFHTNCIFLPYIFLIYLYTIVSLSHVFCISWSIVHNQTKNVSCELSFSLKSNQKSFLFLDTSGSQPLFSTAPKISAELFHKNCIYIFRIYLNISLHHSKLVSCVLHIIYRTKSNQKGFIWTVFLFKIKPKKFPFFGYIWLPTPFFHSAKNQCRIVSYELYFSSVYILHIVYRT